MAEGVYRDVGAIKRGSTERDIASRVNLKRGFTEAPHPFKRVNLKEGLLQQRGKPLSVRNGGLQWRESRVYKA